VEVVDVMATSEETREGCLRRLASKEGNIFRKLRKPENIEGWAFRATYMLTNENKWLLGAWETLEEAEKAMLEK
jgi:hypothetical protein